MKEFVELDVIHMERSRREKTKAMFESEPKTHRSNIKTKECQAGVIYLKDSITIIRNEHLVENDSMMSAIIIVCDSTKLLLK